MASLQECEAALQLLAARFAAVDVDLRRRHAADRTVSCRVPDLAVVFSVRVTDGCAEQVERRPVQDAGAQAQAQVRLTASSDDLVALVSGELTPPVAWATGRLTVEASVLDLLRMRSLL